MDQNLPHDLTRYRSSFGPGVLWMIGANDETKVQREDKEELGGIRLDGGRG